MGVNKCNKVGCDRIDTLHVQVPIMGGMMIADAYFCPDDYDEGVRSLKQQ